MRARGSSVQWNYPRGFVLLSRLWSTTLNFVREHTLSIQSSRASCELRDGFRCRSEITGRGPFEGREIRIYALRMAIHVDEGMHFQVIIIAVTKVRVGARKPRLSQTASIYRRGGGYLPSLSGRSIPRERKIIASYGRDTFSFFFLYILISIIGNWHEFVTGSYIITALSHSFDTHHRFFLHFRVYS